MLFPGYRQVIASMWNLFDQPAPVVADIIYSALSASGRPNSSQAAEALHKAVRSLRKSNPADPLIWAPYLHLGA
jgi:CHAT domain-containing protein